MGIRMTNVRFVNCFTIFNPGSQTKYHTISLIHKGLTEV